MKFQKLGVHFCLDKHFSNFEIFFRNLIGKSQPSGERACLCASVPDILRRHCMKNFTRKWPNFSARNNKQALQYDIEPDILNSIHAKPRNMTDFVPFFICCSRFERSKGSHNTYERVRFLLIFFRIFSDSGMTKFQRFDF